MRKWLRFLFHPELGRSFAASGSAWRTLGRQWAQLFVARRTGWRWRDALAPGRRVPAGLGAALILAGLVGLVWAALALLAADAGAQNVPPDFFADPGTATEEILAFLTGLGEDAGPALSRMMTLFNTGMLVLAGFLLVYHTVAGTVATAREGRWGFGGWEIVRVVLAVALLAPLPGSGLNGGQHVVLGLAKLGAGFADRIWTPMQDQVITGREILVPSGNSVAWRAAIVGALSAETCRYVANATHGGQEVVRVREAARREALVRHYDGVEGGRRRTEDLCGAIVYEGLNPVRMRGGLVPVPVEETAAIRASRTHREALEAVLPVLQGVAAEFGEAIVGGRAGEDLPDVAASLEAAGVVETYRAVLDSGLGQAQDQAQTQLMEEAARASAEKGWLGAASIFNVVARRAGEFQISAVSAPRAVGPVANLADKSSEADKAVQALVANLEGSPVFGVMASGPAGRAVGGREGESGRIDAIFQWLEFDLTVVADSGNPIADLSALGHTLIEMAMTTMIGVAGLSAASGPVVPGLWTVMDGFVGTVAGIMLVAGAVLAYVVPALPFIRFLFGIFAWVLSVVEAVLAVSVFAAAHVTRGEGNSLVTSATRQGWLFLPGLVLRPVLMLFGLLLGYFVAVAVVGLFSDIWLPYLASSRESGGLGIIGFPAMLALYTFVAFGLLNGAFKLIDILPDAVLQWIGGRAGAGDAGADRVGSATTAGFGQVGALRLGGAGRGRAIPGGSG